MLINNTQIKNQFIKILANAKQLEKNSEPNSLQHKIYSH